MKDRKTRILIVENEYMAAQFFKMVLEQKGYEVIGTATTSQEAIDLVKARAPDVVCMDIGLESPSAGIDSARAILELSMELNPRAYLVKPINIKELFTVIADIRGE